MRIKENAEIPLPIVNVQESFEHILNELIRNNVNLDRIYICGTQKMNNSISKCL